MILEQLSISHCRIIEQAELSLSPSMNIIVGDNGSGKSSILEAVSVLSRGRSFRTSRIADVIRHSQESMLIRATCSEPPKLINIGIEKSRQVTRIRVNQQDVHTQAALSRYLPVTIIDPNAVDLLTGSPSLRRSYIDWVAFYLYPDFQSVWKNYQRILKQRNFCLRQFSTNIASLDIWTDELIKAQRELHEFRVKALAVVEPELLKLSGQLLTSHELSMTLTSGFPQGVSLDDDAQRSFYQERRDADIQASRTVSGIHRSDLQVKFNGALAQQSASRGQLKLIAITMLLAQSRSIDESHERKGIIAIDDLAAELDTENKKKLLTTLRELKQQLLLTTTQDGLVALTPEDRMFHVKHGEVNLKISGV